MIFSLVIRRVSCFKICKELHADEERTLDLFSPAPKGIGPVGLGEERYVDRLWFGVRKSFLWVKSV